MAFRLAVNNSRKTGGRLNRAQGMELRLENQKVRRRQGGAPLVVSWRGPAVVIGRLFIMAFAALLVTAGLLGGYAALAGNPAFAIRKAEITGTNRLGRLDVLRAAGVGSHSNFFSLPVGSIEAALKDLPWVHDASVRRAWPGTVHIDVTEYEARQLALLEGGFYYLDAKARAFAPVNDVSVPDLPLITGLSRPDLMDPDEENKVLLAASISVLDELAGMGKSGLGNLSEIHLDRVWGVSLVFDEINAVVRLGHYDFATRLQRLAKVLDDLKRREELDRAMLIDLTGDNRVTVRLMGDAA